VAEEDGGNIRAPGERRTFLAGLAAFGRDFAVRTFQGAVGVAVLFVPFGVVAAMVAWDASFLLGIPLIGAFIGLLINGGSTFEAWFSEARPSGETSAEAAPDGMLHAWARMFQPRSVTLLQGLHGLLTHDYSQGRPGRWKRAAVGGLAGTVFGVFLWWCLSRTLPRVEPSVATQLGFILFPAAAGVVIGVLSDSF